MKSDSELSPELRSVARERGTEAPFTGAYVDTYEEGTYRCAICGVDLFSSKTKFDSGTGWPSFTDPANLENIVLKQEAVIDGSRIEVICKNCGAHLGHVFDDGPVDESLPPERQGKRYCINSVCIDFNPDLSAFK